MGQCTDDSRMGRYRIEPIINIPTEWNICDNTHLFDLYVEMDRTFRIGLSNHIPPERMVLESTLRSLEVLMSEVGSMWRNGGML